MADLTVQLIQPGTVEAFSGSFDSEAYNLSTGFALARITTDGPWRINPPAGIVVAPASGTNASGRRISILYTGTTDLGDVTLSLLSAVSLNVLDTTILASVGSPAATTATIDPTSTVIFPGIASSKVFNITGANGVWVPRLISVFFTIDQIEGNLLPPYEGSFRLSYNGGNLSITNQTLSITANDFSTIATATITPGNVAVTTHPSDATVDIGDAASFTVAAAGTPTITYQWQRQLVNSDGSLSSFANISTQSPDYSGTRSTTLTVNESFSTRLGATRSGHLLNLRCVVSSGSSQSTSNVAEYFLFPEADGTADWDVDGTVSSGSVTGGTPSRIYTVDTDSFSEYAPTTAASNVAFIMQTRTTTVTELYVNATQNGQQTCEVLTTPTSGGDAGRCTIPDTAIGGTRIVTGFFTSLGRDVTVTPTVANGGVQEQTIVNPNFQDWSSGRFWTGRITGITPQGNVTFINGNGVPVSTLQNPAGANNTGSPRVVTIRYEVPNPDTTTYGGGTYRPISVTATQQST